MQKTLPKSSSQKTRAAGSDKLRTNTINRANKNTNYATHKKVDHTLLQVLNYKYRDSDLEQFDF
jgi:hypothetical protein